MSRGRQASAVGQVLQSWRQRRRMSQLDLAIAASVTPRHVSFVETGRSSPSRDMLLVLAEALEMPLRDRNDLYLAAGFAPPHRELGLDDDELRVAMSAVERILASHDPLPAVVLDRHWNLVRANQGAQRLFGAMVDLGSLPAPVNVLELIFDPHGLRSHIANFAELAPALLARARREAVGGIPDPTLGELIAASRRRHPRPPLARAERRWWTADRRGVHRRWLDRPLLLHRDDTRHSSRCHPPRAAHRDVPSGLTVADRRQTVSGTVTCVSTDHDDEPTRIARTDRHAHGTARRSRQPRCSTAATAPTCRVVASRSASVSVRAPASPSSDSLTSRSTTRSSNNWQQLTPRLFESPTAPTEPARCVTNPSLPSDSRRSPGPRPASNVRDVTKFDNMGPRWTGFSPTRVRCADGSDEVGCVRSRTPRYGASGSKRRGPCCRSQSPAVVQCRGWHQLSRHFARGVQSIVAEWKPQRSERQARRSLERADFDQLRDAGFLYSVVPEEMGGLWRDTPSSARSVCDLLRLLATADSSVALVSSMHPSVVAFWLLNPDPSQPLWEQQRQAVFASAAAGEQWGTITSEPGSGGDIARTRATATPTDDEPFLVGSSYAVSGDKHFGSGSGIADRMITTAIPDGRGRADDLRARRARPARGTEPLGSR